MATSHEWRCYFEQNARSLLDIPWQAGAELTPDEIAAISKSLREFQAGESSEGKHLFHYAQDYADRTGDGEYIAAIRLFIGEEGRHARDLGRFLTINGIALVKTTFADRVFRRLRSVFGGLECSIGVLITAEIIAKVYYAVIREATQSTILRRLCSQILSDEERHVQFQAEQLGKLRAGRGRLAMAATMFLQWFLYLGATCVVGVSHRRAIRRGGLSFVGWYKSCMREFWESFAEAPAAALQPDSIAPPAIASLPSQ